MVYICKGEIISNADPRHPNQIVKESKPQFGWLGRPMGSLSGLNSRVLQKCVTDCSTYPRRASKNSLYIETVDGFDDNNILDVLARAFSVENRYFELPCLYSSQKAVAKPLRVPFILVIILGLFYLIFGQRALIFAAVVVLFYAISTTTSTTSS